MERAITNIAQAQRLGLLRPGRRYDPIDLWNEAKKIDEWDDTNPGDDNGTSVRAAYDIAREKGLCRVTFMRMGSDGVPVPFRPRSRDRAEGIERNRWARTTDEVRTAIAKGVPVAIGVNWYTNFDRPVSKPSPTAARRCGSARATSAAAAAGTACVSTARATSGRRSS